MKKVIYYVLMLALLAGVSFGCAQAPAPAPTPKPAPKPTPAPAPAPKGELITLKALTFISPKSGSNKMYIEYINRVNEAAKGELFIDLVGGPEVIGTFDQAEALRTGVIDLDHIAAARYDPILPEGAAFALSEINSAEQRKSGFADLMVELHKKINYYYIGNLRHGPGFYLWTNFLPETPYDLAGHRMRTGSLYDLFMKAIGIAPITMSQSEVYTAIERGLVDGFGDTTASVQRYKFYEVTKYRIDHKFYYPNVTTVMNLDKWNSLPKHLQDLMQDIMLEMEPEAVAHFDSVAEANDKSLLDAGMEFIKFSPADAKWYVDTAYRAAWDDFMKKSPENAPKLKKLSSR